MKHFSVPKSKVNPQTKNMKNNPFANLGARNVFSFLENHLF